jgi:hypothetical protein
MRRLRAELHRRMLGNGYCARPVEMDCHLESICESCTFFVTTLEFRPTLQKQRDDAERKGQVGRQKIFEGLLSRLEDPEGRLRTPPVAGWRGSDRGRLDRGAARPACGGSSSAEHHVDPAHHLGELLGGQLRHALREQDAIDGDDLGSIGHRILPEARGAGGKEDVPGRPGPRQIAGQRHTDHRGNPAAIEVIALHDHHRSAEAGPRAGGWGQTRPPHLALRDGYHSVRSRMRRAAAVTKGSGGSFNWSRTRFMASVTSSGACRERYSERASA